jgi:hypothetical protein
MEKRQPPPMPEGEIQSRAYKEQPTPAAAQMVIFTMWFFLLLFLGTILGIWIKLFWIGFVSAGC